jgi:hypothetical protein
MAERKDFEVQRRARSDEEPQRVEQRSEDGDHDKSVSKNGGNLKGRNGYGVSGRDRQAKLQAVKLELRRRLHLSIPEVGAYLRAVVRGHVNYTGSP